MLSVRQAIFKHWSRTSRSLLLTPLLAACVQDDTKDSPAKKPPQHQSGVVGDVPNQQLILQV